MTERLFRREVFEHERSRQEDFDPIAEGKRYGLTPEVSDALWEHVRRAATSSDGLCDENAARLRFAQLAELIARNGGQLGPEAFHWTQIDAALGRLSLENLLAERVPGRTTLVLAEASARARVALRGVPGRTTLVANHVTSEVSSIDESRGFFRRYVSGGLAARAKLERAIASRDHAAAIVASLALQQELRWARHHLANGLEHDEGLRAELATLEGPAEQLLAKLPNMSAGGRPSDLWVPNSAEWRAATGGDVERAESQPQPQGDARLDEPRGPERLPASLHSWISRQMASSVDQILTAAARVSTDVGPPPELAMKFELLGPPASVAAPRVATREARQFDELRVHGLRELVGVAGAYGGISLADATLAAAAPAIAAGAAPGRAARARSQAPAAPAGQAMWRAAERYAATLYRRAVDAGELDHRDPAVEAALLRCGAGRPLPRDVQRTMSAQLGVPLDRVRIHTDEVAAAAAQAVHAEAFTVGEDIFFAAGAFEPSSLAGQRLLAHELTHVVQAWQGRVDTTGRVSQPGDALEREAEAVAEHVAARAAEPERAPGQAPGHPIDRRDAPGALAGFAGAAERSVGRSGEGAGPTEQPVTPGPIAVRAPSAQPVLRRAAGGAAAGGAAGPRSTRPAMKGGAKRPADQRAQQSMQGASAEFQQRAGGATASATGKLKHEIADAHTRRPGQRAHEQVKAERRAGKADEHALHGTARQHLDEANAHAGDAAEAAAPAPKKPGGAAHARSSIKFKPISDWSKYMPAPLPDQDERERKRIEKLVKTKIEDERNKSGLALEGLRAAHMQQARDVRAMKPKLQAQVATAQQNALAHVSSSESSQCAAINGHIASVQSQVRGHAAAMKAQVTSAHAAAVGKINATHDAAITKLTEQRTQAQTSVELSEMLAVLTCQLDFAALHTRYTSLGSKKAGDALQVGETEAGKMPGRWEGEKLEEAQKAARQVADGFATSMPEQAAQKWDEISAQQAPAEQGLRDYATATKGNLTTIFEQAKQALEAARNQSIQAADAAKTASIAQIDQACSSTVASLAAQGASQVAAVRQQGRAARHGITTAGAAARTSVAQAVDQAAAGIEGGITGLIRGATQVEAPIPTRSSSRSRGAPRTSSSAPAASARACPHRPRRRPTA